MSLKTKTWNIYRLATWTHDRREIVASYSNRGQAIARVRGLRREAWRAGSEMIYSDPKEA